MAKKSNGESGSISNLESRNFFEKPFAQQRATIMKKIYKIVQKLKKHRKSQKFDEDQAD